MQDIITFLSDQISNGSELVQRLLRTALVLAALAILRRILARLIWKHVEDVRLRYRWRKITAYVLTAVGLLVIGRIWFEAFGTVATFFGLLSAGLAIALRDMITNLAGWLFITWRRPFTVGDRVQIGEFAGDVIDQRAFQFSLLEIGNWVHADQSTGRVIHMPNGKVFTEPLANFTQGLEYIWNEIPVLVTFESDWRKAKRILGEIASRHAEALSEEAERQILSSVRRYMIFYSTLRPIVYTAAEASGVLLTIRYLCEPRKRRGTSEAMWEEILDAFAEHDDIDFAYPTQRFFDNLTEGKRGLIPGESR